MPALTRRRDPDVAQETWRIHYGHVVVGTLAQCIGNPGAAPGWEWRAVASILAVGRANARAAPTGGVTNPDQTTTWHGT
jgi:hypothetical protein